MVESCSHKAIVGGSTPLFGTVYVAQEGQSAGL